MAERKPNFSSLPPELRLLVLQSLAEAHSQPTSSCRGIAAYASVCKHWQLFFEPITFKYFIIRHEDLVDFRKVTQPYRRRCMIKHVWLRLEEPSPEQRQDMGLDSQNWSKAFYTSIIWHLWTTFSDWKLATVGEFDGNPGLTLELSGHKHLTESATGAMPTDDLDMYSKFQETGSVSIYEEDGRKYYVSKDMEGAMDPKTRRDLFCKGFRLDDTKPLPRLEVVTELVTRRACTRNLRPEVMALIFNSLTRLQTVRIERWRHGLVSPEGDWCLGMEPVLSQHLPASLKALSVFEESGTRNSRFDLIPKDKLTEAVIMGTLHLKCLSLCFVINAEAFLDRICTGQPQQLNGGYIELTSLTLTSDSLKAEINEEWDMSLWLRGVRDLIYLAAMAAKRMPKLRLMEIWNSGDGTSSIFQYKKADDDAFEISWKSTQNCNPFEDDVVQAWREAVVERGQSEVTISPPMLLSGDFEYYGSTIPYLKSRNMVLHPVSAAQMK